MKKLLLSLGTVATVVAPVTAVVACGDEKKTKATIAAPLITEEKAKIMKTATFNMAEAMIKVDSQDQKNAEEGMKEIYSFFENHTGQEVILIMKNAKHKITISKEFKKGIDIKDTVEMEKAMDAVVESATSFIGKVSLKIDGKNDSDDIDVTDNYRIVMSEKDESEKTRANKDFYEFFKKHIGEKLIFKSDSWEIYVTIPKEFDTNLSESEKIREKVMELFW